MTDIERAALAGRITQYLRVGGLWNPEAMDHDKVRDLLIDCRAALSLAQPEGWVSVPVEQWDVFVSDYNRYTDGDPKMDFQTLRISLAAMLESVRSSPPPAEGKKKAAAQAVSQHQEPSGESPAQSAPAAPAALPEEPPIRHGDEFDVRDSVVTRWHYDALRQHAARLQAELAEEKRQTEIALNAYASENQRISDQLEAARVNKERYLWLRDVGDSTWVPLGKRPGVSFTHEVDKAIDAALAGKERK